MHICVKFIVDRFNVHIMNNIGKATLEDDVRVYVCAPANVFEVYWVHILWYSVCMRILTQSLLCTVACAHVCVYSYCAF